MYTTQTAQALGEVAKLANALAKQLKGHSRTLAYRIKCEALSALVLQGWARPNGIRPDGTVGLDVECDPPVRLHVPLNRLSRKARVAISAEVRSVPVTAPLGELLKVSSLRLAALKSS